MDDAKLFILQNYYIDEEAKELGFKQLCRLIDFSHYMPNLTHCIPIRKKTQEYLLSKIANPKIKEVIKTANIVTVEKTTKKNAKTSLYQAYTKNEKHKRPESASWFSTVITFQHEGGWIIQIGDSETEKELLEVIDNVCAWIEKYDKEQKYLLAQFEKKETAVIAILLRTIIYTQKKDGSFETNEKITKKSALTRGYLNTAAPTMSIINQNSNRKRILDASNNYVIDELTREDSDSDDDLDEMNKKYLTQKYDFTHLEGKKKHKKGATFRSVHPSKSTNDLTGGEDRDRRRIAMKLLNEEFPVML
ncbi:hypothetical protein Glove_198g100 [Diversispora epigaea]|uniref:Uncharacterized protein n=1 Tax=Diversispora epigaea TaxID=1348612 RepID=A0A397INH7_9GLOM|nr:hypothetical protein Glove_198g100 [Diversispora epigaea]